MPNLDIIKTKCLVPFLDIDCVLCDNFIGVVQKDNLILQSLQ